jgi:hypothetical protein
MISIILNIITLALVAILVYAFYRMYKFREDKDLTASQLFRLIKKEPAIYSHRAFTEPTGEIGNFVGYEVTDPENLAIYDY